jgi:hypothetical protein
VLFLSDAARAYRVVRGQQIGRSNLAAFAKAVDSARANADSCLLIGESTPMSEGMVFPQIRREVDYLEFLTPCRFINGSFIQRGKPNSRTIDGFPTPEIFPTDSAVIFVGWPTTFMKYRANAGPHRWKNMGGVEGLGIWRFDRACERMEEARNDEEKRIAGNEQDSATADKGGDNDCRD